MSDDGMTNECIFSSWKSKYFLSNVFLLQHIGSGLLIVPLLGLVEAIAIGKAFGRSFLIYNVPVVYS